MEKEGTPRVGELKDSKIWKRKGLLGTRKKKRKGLGYKGLQKMEKERTPSKGEEKVSKEWRRKELQGMEKEMTQRNEEGKDSKE